MKLAEKTQQNLEKSQVKQSLFTYSSSCVCLLVAVGWIIFLFPKVSLSTGEAKPRGLFVDEHALPVHSQLLKERAAMGPSFIAYHQNISSESSWMDSCSQLTEVIGDAECLEWPSFTGHLLQLQLSSSRAGRHLESIVVVLSYASTHAASTAALIDIIGNLRHAFAQSAAWLAKNVILLLPVSEGFDHFTLMHHWLAKHTCNNADDTNDTIVAPMIREVVVLDISALAHDSQLLLHEQVLLQITGFNGILPNMDMLSMAKVLHPRVLAVESEPGKRDACIAFVKKWVPLDITFTSRLCALREFFALLLFQKSVRDDEFDSKNVHAAFTALNIDAMTYFPLPYKSKAEGSRMQQLLKQRGRNEGKSEEAIQSLHIQQLSNLLFRTIYTLNNLHEELHHSYHLYLLLAPGHFASVSEYGGPAVLLLLSLLILFQHTVSRTAAIPVTYITLSAIGLLLELAPFLLYASLECFCSFNTMLQSLIIIMSVVLSITIGFSFERFLLSQRLINNNCYAPICGSQILLLQISAIAVIIVQHFSLGALLALLIAPISLIILFIGDVATQTSRWCKVFLATTIASITSCSIGIISEIIFGNHINRVDVQALWCKDGHMTHVMLLMAQFTLIIFAAKTIIYSINSSEESSDSKSNG